MTLRAVVDIIRTNAAERPDAPAIFLGDRTVTFGELDRRSSQVAYALAAAGVGERDHVAYIGRNALPYFEVLFGALKRNAILVGVNWRLAPPEMAHIVGDAEAKVLFVGPEFVGHVEKVADQLGTVTTLVALEAGGPAGWETYEEWVSGHPEVDTGIVPEADDVALQLYTSGTTGLPKGAMITNTNLTGVLNQASTAWGISQDSVSLAAMPMFHIGGSGWALASLAFGASVVVLPEVDPNQILEVIPKFGVTDAFIVPAVIQMLLAMPATESTDFSSLNTIFYGAAPITDATLMRAVDVFGCRFVQLYGLTETTGAVTQLEPEDHDPVNRPELLRSCGRVYPWMELRVVDVTTGEEAAPGEIGELWMRGPQVMKGYWANEEATAESITADGWFRSGDIGFVDSDGYVFLNDRLKDMIVSGGENVYPTEVENALAKHPDVADVAVIAVPDDKWGEAVKAVVVPKPGVVLDTGALLAFARERLAGFKVPKSVDLAEVLPRNPSGKILKRELRAPYWEGHDRQVH